MFVERCPLLRKRAMAAKSFLSIRMITRILKAGFELTVDQAFQLLVESNLVPERVTRSR